MDPRCTARMIEREEEVWQEFEELKRTLPTVSPRLWKKSFKHYVDEFIEDRLDEKEYIPCEDEEETCTHLHELRHLVAGAVQEWELAQQPKQATACAKLDGALVWQGRGYVSPILHIILSL
jgi:hypothetical protein